MDATGPGTDYAYRVEVCYTPGQYPLYQQDMGIVVVIDILRATSAMVAALHHGVKDILPVATVEEARQYIGREGYIAAAERNDRMTLLVWVAPKEYYHGRDAAAVDAMLDGMRFK